MDSYRIDYVDAEGENDVIEVEAEDEANAEEAARERLSAAHPGVDTDEWEIVACERIEGITP